MNTTPPVEIAAWLACFLFVVMGVNAVMKLVDRVKPKEPEPPLHKQYASREELTGHAKWDDEQHILLHNRINVAKSEFIPRDLYLREIQQRDEFRSSTEKKLDRLLAGVAALAAKNGVEIEL